MEPMIIQDTYYHEIGIRWDSEPILADGRKRDSVFCPICDCRFWGSDYLRKVFKDIPSRWLANMVTHYRHEHITWWDKKWSGDGYGKRYLSEREYQKQKAIQNERSKRQIIRKCRDYLRNNGVTHVAFQSLKGTEPKTLKVFHQKVCTPSTPPA